MNHNESSSHQHDSPNICNRHSYTHMFHSKYNQTTTELRKDANFVDKSAICKRRFQKSHQLVDTNYQCLILRIRFIAMDFKLNKLNEFLYKMVHGERFRPLKEFVSGDCKAVDLFMQICQCSPCLRMSCLFISTLIKCKVRLKWFHTQGLSIC